MIRTIRQLLRRWRMELRFNRAMTAPSHASPVPLPGITRRRLRRAGFFPNKYSSYGLAEADDWGVYLSDRQMLMSSWIDGSHAVMLEDKLVFYLAIHDLLPVPDVFLAVCRGTLSWIHGDRPEDGDVLGLLEREKHLVVKPVRGNQGNGVSTLAIENGAWLKDGRRASAGEVQATAYGSGDVIVTAHVEQAPFEREVYPGSVNTMRIITMLDPDEGVPFIPCARHRFGTDESSPCDNVSRGGVSCPIGLETGQLGDAVAPAPDGGLRTVEKHPDTGVVFRDLVIPGWAAIVEQVLSVSARLPMLPYIAWDLALTEYGICAIEANHWTEVHSFQATEPWLADPRIRRFFEYHGIA